MKTSDVCFSSLCSKCLTSARADLVRKPGAYCFQVIVAGEFPKEQTWVIYVWSDSGRTLSLLATLLTEREQFSLFNVNILVLVHILQTL
jgi:hypothetical protein